MDAQRQEKVARGARIEGSKYFRDWCATCKEPIRVIGIRSPNQCTRCAHPMPEGGNPAHPQIFQHDEDRGLTWNN